LAACVVHVWMDTSLTGAWARVCERACERARAHRDQRGQCGERRRQRPADGVVKQGPAKPSRASAVCGGVRTTRGYVHAMRMRACASAVGACSGHVRVHAQPRICSRPHARADGRMRRIGIARARTHRAVSFVSAESDAGNVPPMVLVYKLLHTLNWAGVRARTAHRCVRVRVRLVVHV
jgi:hypothetical protein